MGYETPVKIHSFLSLYIAGSIPPSNPFQDLMMSVPLSKLPMKSSRRSKSTPFVTTRYPYGGTTD
jgi:hypothetical protein